MSSKKIVLMALGWFLLAVPVLSKATGIALGLNREFLFALCWVVGAPILIYAKLKLR